MFFNSLVFNYRSGNWWFTCICRDLAVSNTFSEKLIVAFCVQSIIKVCVKIQPCQCLTESQWHCGCGLGIIIIIIWQEATLPSGQRWWWRMHSSHLDPIYYMVPWSRPPNGILIGSLTHSWAHRPHYVTVCSNRPQSSYALCAGDAA